MPHVQAEGSSSSSSGSGGRSRGKLGLDILPASESGTTQEAEEETSLKAIKAQQVMSSPSKGPGSGSKRKAPASADIRSFFGAKPAAAAAATAESTPDIRSFFGGATPAKAKDVAVPAPSATLAAFGKPAEEKEAAASSTAEPPTKRPRKTVVDDDDDDDDDDDGDAAARKSSDPDEDQIVKVVAPPPTSSSSSSSSSSNSAPSRGGAAAQAAGRRPPASRNSKDDEEDDDDNDDEDDEDDQDDDNDDGPNASSSSSPARAASAASINALPEKYDPVESASWKAGEPVPYAAMVEVFQFVENTTKRLKIQERVCQFLRSVIALSPDDLLPCVYLCVNKLAPSFAGVEIGIGDSLLVKAIEKATGRDKKTINKQYDELGDLGLVALESRKSQSMLFGMKPKALTVRDVHAGLLFIAKESGKNSQDKKTGRIQKLLVACTGDEAKYVVRACQGKLRIGLAEQTLLVSLAHALVLTPPNEPSTRDARATMSTNALAVALENAVVELKQVFSELPTYDEIIPAALKVGISRLHEECHVRAGVPLKPMLAKPTKGVTEILDRFENVAFTCEFKYDGERAQIHMLEDGTMNVYSRNSENNTAKYPDVMRNMKSAVAEGVTSFIIDTEVVAYDVDTKTLLPFQVLSTRSRKDVDADNVKVQVIVCAFDLIFLNGESYLKKTLRERRAALHASFRPVEGCFTFAHAQEANDPEEMLAFLDESVKGNCEGLMVKTLDDNATYEPSRRSLNWLKLKKDYVEGLTDSLDLVPIGAFMGRGKRTGVYGAFLLASYDEDNECFQSITKIGTGFSDEELKAHFEALSQHVVPGKPLNVESAMECDVWFEPRQVWEVRAADLSISPKHTAAMGKVKAGKGIALRFPRFLRLRDDKGPEDATNAEQVADMYRSQNLSLKGDLSNELDEDF